MGASIFIRSNSSCSWGFVLYSTQEGSGISRKAAVVFIGLTLWVSILCVLKKKIEDIFILFLQERPCPWRHQTKLWCDLLQRMVLPPGVSTLFTKVCLYTVWTGNTLQYIHTQVTCMTLPYCFYPCGSRCVSEGPGGLLKPSIPRHQRVLSIHVMVPMVVRLFRAFAIISLAPWEPRVPVL